MSKEIPKISDAEWKVVELLWDRAPRTSTDIVEALAGINEWSPKTVKTLLFRLTKKGVLGFDGSRREYFYYPLIEKEKYLKVESEGFLQRVFKGATAPMIAHFVKSEKLKPGEADEIRRILDEIVDRESLQEPSL